MSVSPAPQTWLKLQRLQFLTSCTFQSRLRLSLEIRTSDMSVDSAGDLLLDVTHIKFRNNNAGKSPIGSLRIFSEHVEWKDSTTEESSKFSFVQIKGQRVSPPNKSKVQLQLCLHNDDQATFVFLNPSYDKDGLIKERDLVKETLQQALVAHRQRVAQLAAKNESCSKTAELEAKQKLLLQSKQLEQLYKHLVTTKLITPQEFWTDYYKSNGLVEEQVGVSGGFLANIAQIEGANGVKLNLNTEIIQAIFNTYPIVEKKHLELVPHEMTEPEFWSKFFQSHYFHREREVIPNPNDPFADCVRSDEAEIEKLVSEGVQRRRFDFDYLCDNVLADINKKPEVQQKTGGKTILVRRCNYLSERILASFSANVDAPVGDGSANSASVAPSAVKGTTKTNGTGFGALNKRIVYHVESRLESEELCGEDGNNEVHPVKVAGEESCGVAKYDSETACCYRSLVREFFDSNTDEEILGDSSWIDALEDREEPVDVDVTAEDGFSEVPLPSTSTAAVNWGLPSADVAEIHAIHDAVAELLKHFWSCFPASTPDLEKKLDRMMTTIKKYQLDQLAHAGRKYGMQNFEHCFLMVDSAQARYDQFLLRKKK